MTEEVKTPEPNSNTGGDGGVANEPAAKAATQEEPKADTVLGGKEVEVVEIEVKASKDSPLSSDDLAGITGFAKENGLSQDAAQALVKHREGLVEQGTKAAVEQHTKLVSKWLEESKSDPEIGGHRFVEMSEHAKRACDHFAGQEFKELLNNSGLGNHREFIKVFSKIGKLMADDKLIKPEGEPARKDKDLSTLMYGEPKKT